MPCGVGGGTHRSWPVPKKGAGGGRGLPRAVWGSGKGWREGLGGGSRASIPGGVGGRGTGPRDGAVVSNAYKKKKNGVF